MSFWNCVYTLLLMPLQILFEFVYNIAFKFIKDPGLTIVVLSITINLLVLPLYRKTDQIQEEERQIEAKLAKGIAHIKKTFRGDERTMMLQTYYRQNHYSPVHTLKSALSLFLEIPFFIAAYRFLSGLELLNGAVLGPIKDLGAPDALIHVLGISINLLPILMTAINIVTAALFTKGQPLKSKIQLYGMALVFWSCCIVHRQALCSIGH
ncbi:MAG: YidC/Oxa1 family membrane protein insertase [Clostridia bacterium]|nr:YidC/Oxa1 family membrane protein insertase [Clostridia bacterium]